MVLGAIACIPLAEFRQEFRAYKDFKFFDTQMELFWADFSGIGKPISEMRLKKLSWRLLTNCCTCMVHCINSQGRTHLTSFNLPLPFSSEYRDDKLTCHHQGGETPWFLSISCFLWEESQLSQALSWYGLCFIYSLNSHRRQNSQAPWISPQITHHIVVRRKTGIYWGIKKRKWNQDAAL